MSRRAQVLLFSCLVAAVWPSDPAAGADQKKVVPLAVAHATMLEAEDGAPVRSDTVFQPGEALYLAFNIQGYTADKNNHVKLSYSIDSLDFKGVPFVPPEAGKVEEELSPQDAKWLPRVRFSPTLPPFADSGQYKFAIRVTDEIAHKQAAFDFPFQVHGRDVEPSPTLVVRNFHFARQEDGEPLPAPAYRRGDVLWAAFDITGYKVAEKNQIGVDYHLSVLNGEDKQIFDQPESAEEKSASFYPRRYVHAVFNLNLESGIKPGEYTILLKTRDLLGNQTYETRQKFTIE
jgi:hypothetical protein